jgi:hypothetical protein
MKDFLEAAVAFLPPQVWAYWLYMVGGISWGLIFPSLSGMILNLRRPLEDPLNMPLNGYKHFDLRRFDYNDLQKFRHQLGYPVFFFMIMSGYLGVSGLLEDEPYLERYARYVILLGGIGSPTTHIQFNHERYKKGVQMVTTWGLMLCVTGQALYCYMTYKWLRQVQEVVSPPTSDLKLLVGSTWGIFAFLALVNIIRLYSFLRGGPKYFFEPLVKRDKEKAEATSASSCCPH